jgi:hypothetical protein
MQKLILLAVLGCSLFGNLAQAQVAETWPPPPATKLGFLETNLSTVIIKGTSEVGAITESAGVISVRCREITDLGSGRKEQGIAMEITLKGQGKDTLLIDYDEIAPLSTAIDYLNKLDFSVTQLNFFDAEYTTKGGFRVAAFGLRRTSAVQFSVRDTRLNMTPITLSQQNVARLKQLIDQAKITLDSLRGG